MRLQNFNAMAPQMSRRNLNQTFSLLFWDHIKRTSPSALCPEELKYWQLPSGASYPTYPLPDIIVGTHLHFGEQCHKKHSWGLWQSWKGERQYFHQAHVSEHLTMVYCLKNNFSIIKHVLQNIKKKYLIIRDFKKSSLFICSGTCCDH